MVTTTAYPATREAEGVAINLIPGNFGVAGTRYVQPKIVVMARGNLASTYSAALTRVYSADKVGEIYGYGSPLHRICKVLFVSIGDIPVFVLPLDLADGAASGDITPSGTPTKSQEYIVKINNQPVDRFTVADGDGVSDITAAMTTAINAVVDIPVIATDNGTGVGIALKWHGTLGNNAHIAIEAIGDNAEISFAITQPTGGTGIPDITTPLTLLEEDVWYTHIVTDLDYTDSTELDELMIFGQGSDGQGGRRDPEVHKPVMVFTGTNEATLNTVTAVTDARKTDRVNLICPNPGSNDMPYVISAARVREVAKVANVNPARDYINRPMPELTAGTPWKSSERNAAVKAGLSTIKVLDGQVVVSDTVTCYHPTGEEPPLFKYASVITKHMTITNEIDLIVSPLSGRPLVPDGQNVTNPDAIQPKTVKGMLFNMTDRLAKDAIISDPETTNAGIKTGIGGTNQNRLDVHYPAMTSGFVGVVSADIAAGFYFGG